MHKSIAALALTATLAAALPAGAADNAVLTGQGAKPKSFSAQLVAATADATPAAQNQVADDGSNRVLVAGLGAVAGVVALNLAMGGTAALPFMYEAGAGASFTSGPVAASRVLAVGSGVVGALAADHFYRKSLPGDSRAISRSLSQKVEPR